MLTVLVAIWTCVFGGWYWLNRRRFLKIASKIPGPPGYPFIGNALTLWGKPEDVFKKLHKIRMQYTRLVGLWIGPKLHVALFDAKDAEAVLRSKAVEKADEYQFLKPWLGESMLLSSGSKFKRNKKLIMPSFYINNLKSFLPIFNDHAMSMVDRLQQELDKDEFNVHSYLSKTTMDALLETILGIDKETLGKDVLNYANAVGKLGRLIHMRVYKFWLRPEIIFRFSNLRKEQNKYIGLVHGLTDKVIQQRKKRIVCRENDESQKDKQGKVFIDDLLHARDENGIGLSDEDIRAEVLTMMFAGQDTTSSTIGFVLSLLGVHQEVQDKVMTELDDIFGDSPRPTTYGDIQSLRYMDQVIHETWRLYPPIPMIAKKPLEDLVLDSCVIPANSTIGIITMGIHRNPDYFTNPDRFNPDNFLPERASSRHPYSFMPFSAGTRTCPGSKYAGMLAKVILATLLRSYRVFSKRPERDFVLAGQTVLKRREGFLISLKRRERTPKGIAAA